MLADWRDVVALLGPRVDVVEEPVEA